MATVVAYIRAHSGRLVDDTAVETHLFSTLELDSLDVMMLAEELSTRFEVEMELTALIDYPDIEALTQHVHELVAGDAAESALAVTTKTSNDTRHAVGIVGANHQIPRGPTASIEMVTLADDAVTSVPIDRWDVDDKVGVRFGAFLDSVDKFDPIPFGLQTVTCELMDPQQRLVLTSVAELTFDRTYVSQRACSIAQSPSSRARALGRLDPHSLTHPPSRTFVLDCSPGTTLIMREFLWAHRQASIRALSPSTLQPNSGCLPTPSLPEESA